MRYSKRYLTALATSYWFGTNGGPTIECFHVTSYQANFASHPSCDRYVGFLIIAWAVKLIGKYNKMSWYFLFSSYHNIIYDRVTRILKHTLGWNFKFCYKVNQKKKQVLLFFYIPGHAERKPRSGAKLYVYMCVTRRTNPLFSHMRAAVFSSQEVQYRSM